MQRKMVYTAERVHALFASMRADLESMAARHAAEVAALGAKVTALQGEVEEVRALYDELRAVSLARSKTELEIAKLHRLREIGRAGVATRDPDAKLH